MVTSPTRTESRSTAGSPAGDGPSPRLRGRRSRIHSPPAADHLSQLLNGGRRGGQDADDAGVQLYLHRLAPAAATPYLVLDGGVPHADGVPLRRRRRGGGLSGDYGGGAPGSTPRVGGRSPAAPRWGSSPGPGDGRRRPLSLVCTVLRRLRLRRISYSMVASPTRTESCSVVVPGAALRLRVAPRRGIMGWAGPGTPASVRQGRDPRARGNDARCCDILA